MRNLSYTVLSIFCLFLGWLIVHAIVQNNLLLPNPFIVGKTFFGLFLHTDSLVVMAMTLLRLIFALGASLLLGFLLGLISGFHPNVAIFSQPIVTVLRTVPVISIVIILMILFGLNTTPYLITFLMIFPIIYQSTYEGIIDIDQDFIDVYRLEDNRLLTGLRYCYLPLIKTSLKTALLQSAGLGIKVLVMAEYLAQTRDSIGNQLYLSRVNLAYDEVFAWTIFLILLAVVIERFIRRSANIKTNKEFIIDNQSSLEYHKSDIGE